ARRENRRDDVGTGRGLGEDDFSRQVELTAVDRRVNQRGEPARVQSGTRFEDELRRRGHFDAPQQPRIRRGCSRAPDTWAATTPRAPHAPTRGTGPRCTPDRDSPPG